MERRALRGVRQVLGFAAQDVHVAAPVAAANLLAGADAAIVQSGGRRGVGQVLSDDAGRAGRRVHVAAVYLPEATDGAMHRSETSSTVCSDRAAGARGRLGGTVLPHDAAARAAAFREEVRACLRHMTTSRKSCRS